MSSIRLDIAERPITQTTSSEKLIIGGVEYK